MTRKLSETDIARNNDEVRKYHGDFEYWSPEILEQKLKDAEIRLQEHGSETTGTWRSKQVKVDGKWYDLCRTDLKDDVRTYGYVALLPKSSDIAQVTSNYAKTFGARVTDDTIFVIDALSDG